MSQLISKTMNVHAKVEVSPKQNNYGQGDVTDKKVIVCRISSRQKKVPVTRNNDFLWQQ